MGVAQRVVHDLELVEVEQDHGHAPPRRVGVGQHLGGALGEAGTVGQAGEGVGGGRRLESQAGLAQLERGAEGRGDLVDELAVERREVGAVVAVDAEAVGGAIDRAQGHVQHRAGIDIGGRVPVASIDAAVAGDRPRAHHVGPPIDGLQQDGIAGDRGDELGERAGQELVGIVEVEGGLTDAADGARPADLTVQSPVQPGTVEGHVTARQFAVGWARSHGDDRPYTGDLKGAEVRTPTVDGPLGARAAPRPQTTPGTGSRWPRAGHRRRRFRSESPGPTRRGDARARRARR